jgi:DnaK suppressor protein
LQGSDAEERRVQSVEPLAARFRSALELRRDEVLERIDESRPGLTEHEGGASSGRGDPADAPDEIETAAALEDQIARIDRALERLENGEYGRCLECGERIRLRLLDDEPARELCEACEELL